jgi:dipeptidase D
VAIAAMMAVAEEDGTPHGRLELLMTVAEEVGLAGAQALDPALVTGDLLLNLDSEEDGALTIGCAGSEDHVLTLRAPAAPLPAAAEVLRVTVAGGRGGHSGMDIASGRANALKLLAHALRGAGDGLRIAAFAGGASRNAIPRDATALVAGDGVREAVAAADAAARRTYRGTDPDLRITVEPAGAGGAWDEAASARLLDLVATLPAGPLAMSPDFPGLVETSSSIGVAEQEGDALTLRCLSRSQDDDALPVIAAQIAAAARLAGAAYESLGSYPAWRPDPAAPLLATARRTYAALFGAEPAVAATHGGLETALIGAKRPGLPMLSFGPTIEGPHAPGERLHIGSADRFMRLLRALLDELSR